MADRQAQRRRNESLRLDCASRALGARHPHLDEWYSGRAQRSEFIRWSPSRNDLFHGFGDAAGGRRRRSHAGGWRRPWSTAHRAASLAYVLWAIYRSRIFFYGALKPPAETAFGGGTRAASVSGFIQYKFVSSSYRTSADFADLLASTSPLYKYIQGKVDTTDIPKS